MKIEVKTAEELLQAVKNNDVSEICVQDGVYRLSQPIVIERSNLKIYACGNNAVICGLKTIELSAVSGETAEADLQGNGITVEDFKCGPDIDFWEDNDIPKPHLESDGKGIDVFYNGKQMELSRYPEEGYLRISKVYGDNSKMFLKEPSGCSEGVIETDDDKLYDIIDDDTLFIGYWARDWALQRHKAEKIENRKIYLEKPYHFLGYRYGKDYVDETPGGRFIAVNSKKALDKPGKWCIDHKKQKLYVYPYKGQKRVDVTVCKNLVTIRNCSNITLENIEFFGSTQTAITANGVTELKITGCNIHHTGAWGIDAKDCTKTTVAECRVTYTDGGGISVHGGDRKTLTSSDNLVCRNILTGIAQWHRVYMACIEINGVGITVSENRIFDVPHFAVLHQGNNNIIEKNDIENACYESNDAGAIYGGRDYTCRGIIVRNNYIHNMKGCLDMGCVGIYFDDAFSGAEVYDNIIADMPKGMGIQIGGGRDFKIHNNSFFNCSYAILLDNRVKTWGDWLYDKLIKHLGEIDYKCDVWKKAYPKLYSITEDDIRQPLNNEIYDNAVYGGCGYIISSKEVSDMIKFNNNSFIEDIVPEEVDKWHLTWYNRKK